VNSVPILFLHRISRSHSYPPPGLTLDLLDNCGDFTAGVGGGMNQQQQQQQTTSASQRRYAFCNDISSLENNNLEKKIYHENNIYVQIPKII